MNRIRKLPFIAIALWLMLANPGLAADHPVVPHEAEYRVKISLLRGILKTRVETHDSGYLAQSVIEPRGLAGLLKDGSIREKSEFVLMPGGIRPRRYESVDTLSKDGKRMSFEFDWPAGTVSGQLDDAPMAYELTEAVQDRVSIQYELMHQLLHDEKISDYAMLDGDEIKQLTVSNIGMRKIDVPFGEFDAVGIQHSARNSSRVTTLWCVPELGYLPVIIEQHRKGKLRVRAELESYQPIISEDAYAVAEPLPEIQ